MKPLLSLVLALCTLGCGAHDFLNTRKVPGGERLDFVLGGGGNSLVWRSGGQALVMDAKLGRYGRALRLDVEDAQGLWVRRLVLTHSHGDHVGELSGWRGRPVVLAHPNTRKRLEGKVPESAWVEVEGEVRVVQGGEPLHVLHLGPGHTDGDLVLWFPTRRVLATGDLFLDGNIPNADARAGGDLLGLRRAVERLVALQPLQVLPGHGAPVGPEGLEELLAYLRELEARARRALAAGGAREHVEAQAVVPGFPGLRNIPFGADRRKNARDMLTAIEREVHP